MMQSLHDLLQSSEGLQFLRSNNIFISKSVFLDQLKAPQDPALAAHFDRTGTALVWAGQQVYTDCTPSMIERMKTLFDLKSSAVLFPFFLWVDTDRAGSDDLTMRILWPQEHGSRSIRICPIRWRSCETRFIQLEENRLRRAFADLGAFYPLEITKHQARQAAAERYGHLESFFTQDPPPTLAVFNKQLCEFLLSQFSFRPQGILLSTLLNQSLLTTAVERVLNHLEVIISHFNERIIELLALGIDAHIHPLPVDYLPLNYACPVDNRRLRLSRLREGSSLYAAASCTCGRTYRFYLGSNQLSIASLEETGRWSPDVFLPVFLDNLVSGYIAGQSSAVYYGLLMTEVMERVFGQARLPLLLPPGLLTGTNPKTSLLYAYLRALPL